MRTQSSQMEKDRKQMAVGQMGTCYLGIVSVLKYEKFRGWTVVVAAQRQEFTQVHWTAHLKMVTVVHFMLCVLYHN